ncbi:MAG: hypothetical protein ABFS08_10870 [Pseudomonadota bacterium]
MMGRYGIKNSTIHLTLIILMKAVLDFVYAFYVSEYFYFAGFNLEIDVTKLILSYVLVISLFFMMGMQGNTLTAFAINILMIFLYLPIVSLWALGDRSSVLIILVTFSIITIWYTSKCKLPAMHSSFQSEKVYLFLSWSGVALATLIVILKGGLGLVSFDFIDVYSKRDIFKSYSSTPFFAYIFIWVVKMLIPVLVAHYLLNKKLGVVLLLLSIQLLLFFISGNKEYVFYPLMAIFLSIVPYKSNVAVSTYLLKVLILFTCVVLMFVDDESKVIIVALYSRLFFSVALNHFEYISFFQNNEYVIWSNSIFKYLVSYPYQEPIPNLIGYGRWAESAESFANAGYVASGYMQLGTLAVFMYSIVIGLLLKISVRISMNVPNNIKFTVVGISVIQLINADLPSVILTHGFGIGLLILFMYRSADSTRKCNLLH